MLAPLWAGALSKSSENILEHVQRAACRIMSPGKEYSSALVDLELDLIRDRYKIITKLFAIKMMQNKSFSYLFPKNNGRVTRSNRHYIEPAYKTQRFGSSSIPQFIRLANDESKIKQNTANFFCLYLIWTGGGGTLKPPFPL